MVTLKRRNSHGYTKVEKEDQEEMIHREAQFLIYKTLKKVEVDPTVRRSSSGANSWLRFKICKLKVKIGKRLMKLRKTMLSTIANTNKVSVCKHFMGHFRNFKCFFQSGAGGGRRGGAAAIRRLPQPLFI